MENEILEQLRELNYNLRNLFEAYAEDRQHVDDTLHTTLADLRQAELFIVGIDKKLNRIETTLDAILMELDSLEMDRPLNVVIPPAPDYDPASVGFTRADSLYFDALKETVKDQKPKKRAAKTRKDK